jgi:proteasome lid subunit RPN8/RPN11
VPRRFGLTGTELRQLEAVRVAAGVRLALLAAARTTPGEACAALYGTAAGSLLAVSGRRQLRNSDPGSCFTISVADLLAADTPAAARLVGLFHSHPHSPAVPSELDSLAIARLPFVWAITSRCAGPAGTLRFYAWSTAGVRELMEQRPRASAARGGALARPR